MGPAINQRYPQRERNEIRRKEGEREGRSEGKKKKGKEILPPFQEFWSILKTSSDIPLFDDIPLFVPYPNFQGCTLHQPWCGENSYPFKKSGKIKYVTGHEIPILLQQSQCCYLRNRECKSSAELSRRFLFLGLSLLQQQWEKAGQKNTKK